MTGQNGALVSSINAAASMRLFNMRLFNIRLFTSLIDEIYGQFLFIFDLVFLCYC